MEFQIGSKSRNLVTGTNIDQKKGGIHVPNLNYMLVGDLFSCEDRKEIDQGVSNVTSYILDKYTYTSILTVIFRIHSTHFTKSNILL